MERFAAHIAPDAQTIARLTDDVAAFLHSAGIDARAVHHVSLVVEELLTNILLHGGASDQPANIALTVEPDRVAGEIRDWGKPFDPRDAPAPDLDASLESRKVGGLGVHLVRQLTAALDYRRQDDQNWTTFYVPRSQPAEA
ncbi:MAG TPA: ATP-binding protein [Xanthobacteraceae bacterium]|jgi:sigma-B regulation protein RsbU (phosphoserine phosphatase)